MRLREEQLAAIRRIVSEETGDTAAEVRLFGSRLDDAARGGDVDLFVKLAAPADNPAWLAARLEARIARALDGRDVDVVISAPGLRRGTIHEIAEKEGVLL